MIYYFSFVLFLFLFNQLNYFWHTYIKFIIFEYILNTYLLKINVVNSTKTMQSNVCTIASEDRNYAFFNVIFH